MKQALAMNKKATSPEFTFKDANTLWMLELPMLLLQTLWLRKRLKAKIRKANSLIIQFFVYQGFSRFSTQKGQDFFRRTENFLREIDNVFKKEVLPLLTIGGSNRE